MKWGISVCDVLVERVAIVRGHVDIGCAAAEVSTIRNHGGLSTVRGLGEVVFSVSEGLLFEVLDCESTGIVVLLAVIFLEICWF